MPRQASVSPADGADLPQPASAASHGYRPEIDGLRAIAVLAVILNHIDAAWLPSGHLGVDIFFVISGCVITGSLARQPSSSLADLLGGFYSRRLRRLVPALVLMVVPAALLISLVDPHPHGSLRTGLMALVGFSNLELLQQSTDYFARSAQLNAFTHTWSLGVEEQFYLLYPLLVWCCGFGRQRQGLARLAAAIGLLSLASLIGFALLWHSAPPAAGGCAAGQPAAWPGDPAPAEPAAAGVHRPAVLFPISLALAAVVPGALDRGPERPHTAAAAAAAGAAGLPVLCSRGDATATGPLAPAPQRHDRPWARGPRPGQFGRADPGPAAALRPVQRAAAAAAGRRGGLPQRPHQIPGSRWRWAGEACVLADNRQIGKCLPLKPCTLGDPASARRRVLVLGNSFSATLVAGFDRLVRDEGHAVTVTSSWAASPVPELTNLGPYAPINAHYWNQEVPALLAGLRPGDWVFLASDMMMFSPPQGDPAQRQGQQLALGQLEQGLNRLMRQLQQRGLRLAVLHGNPFAREAECHPASAVPQWFAPAGGPCAMPDRANSLRRRQPLDQLLRQLERRGQLRVVDLFDLFCPGPRCSYSGADGTVLYRDEHSHPSIEAMRLAAPAIRQQLLRDGPAAAQSEAE